MERSKTLKRRFITAIIALIAVLAVAVSTTVAWYIFTVNAHTTKLHMAAGTSVSLQISNSADGEFSSSVSLEKFEGSLNPVSTDSIRGGFQKVAGFTNYSENNSLLANLFSKSLELDKDYYKTSLFFRTGAEEMNIYLSNVGFKDSDENNPISSAIRIGFAVPEQDREFIFAISDKKNPQRNYNTFNGYEGCVLDSSRTDGATVEFTPLDANNYCLYDPSTGAVELKPASQVLCTLHGNGGKYGEPVRVEVYIWLEGCDEDCTNNLCATTLKELALSFAGLQG
ncbi:MAG: hypothetical protein ILP09_01695 [Oscillospiraceae bacterium]|nr:hypothetical protein [Oscillospiraceae bacterium]